MNNKIIILGVNADIGFNICKRYSDIGFEVLGTFRQENENVISLKKYKNVDLLRCDVLDESDIEFLLTNIKNKKFQWTNLFSSIGSSEPIGNFFEIDFNKWERSILLNFTNQMKIIHGLYEFRDKSTISCINLMAGGGTNSAMKHYSAYCVSKIGLIKMCELIDSEYDDLKIQIIGPGFVRTKTHYETLKAKETAGDNYKRVLEFMNSGDQGTSFDDIFKCLRWIDEADKSLTSGRNFSVVHDKWGHKKLEEELKISKDLYKLRREGNNKVVDI